MDEQSQSYEGTCAKWAPAALPDQQRGGDPVVGRQDVSCACEGGQKQENMHLRIGLAFGRRSVKPTRVMGANPSAHEIQDPWGRRQEARSSSLAWRVSLISGGSEAPPPRRSDGNITASR